MGGKAEGGGKTGTRSGDPVRADAETADPATDGDGGRPSIMSLVLPCPLRVLGTVREAETGRPLGELLRALGIS